MRLICYWNIIKGWNISNIVSLLNYLIYKKIEEENNKLRHGLLNINKEIVIKDILDHKIKI